MDDENPWPFFRSLNNVCHCSGVFKNDLRDGISKTYLNGKLFSSTEYKNGKKNGLHKVYFRGKLISTEKYKDDVKIK